jgi:hypothetical protein
MLQRQLGTPAVTRSKAAVSNELMDSVLLQLSDPAFPDSPHLS